MSKSCDIFQFKQFHIAQNRNVHRVGTDGVLLGAWVGLKDRKDILDVGSGIGLLALMIAQRSLDKTVITAIEPDADSFGLAVENTGQSPWKKKINVLNTSIQNFNSSGQFDLIVSNPPFFENSLKPSALHRSRERHSESLPYNALIGASKKFLRSSGRLALIISSSEGNNFMKLASANGFVIVRQCAVFSKELKPQERWLLEFEFHPAKHSATSRLTIMNSEGEWTEEFKLLTSDFYLGF